MPVDGLTLGFAARELDELLRGGRVDRVTQPEKDTVILLIRAGKRGKAPPTKNLSLRNTMAACSWSIRLSISPGMKRRT